MAAVWYIDAGGLLEGPFSLDDLRARAGSGLLLPTDSVSPDRAKWVAARDVPGLTFPSRPLTETVVSGSFPTPDSRPPAPPPDVSPLDSVPGYILEGTLGAGACGVVFRAVQVKLNRVVALKTVRMAENTPPDVLARFDQEAVSLARLQHPNIVAVYDCGHSHGRAFFAMELLAGEDLAARIDRTGPLDERAAWLVARQTAAALAHAAKLGVIHRDIKPANLFLVPPPTGFPLPPGVPMVKVTDFGLALTRGAADGDQRRTAAGVIVGTPVYMAPEQFAGSDVDPRADIYALGATVFHMLAGRAPFDGRTVWEVMRQKAAPLPPLGPDVSAESAELIAAMMAEDPENRPADYDALLARIDALPCLDGGFSMSGLAGVSGRRPSAPSVVLDALPPPAPPLRPRRRALYAAAAGVALLGAAAGIAAVAGVFDPRPDPGAGPNLPSNAAPPAGRPSYMVARQQLLYTSGTLDGWRGGIGVWEIESDDEKTPVLQGRGTAVRPFDPPAHFRVTLGLDPYKATAVDVIVASTGDPPDAAIVWLVRLDRAAGAAFGKRVGTGAFERTGNTVPVPTPNELAEDNKRPYLEVKYERSGGELIASFRGQELARVPAAGLTAAEVRVVTTGGAIRLDYAALEELAEVGK